MSGGTIFPSEYCPGGHVKGGTSHTVTTSRENALCKGSYTLDSDVDMLMLGLGGGV